MITYKVAEMADMQNVAKVHIKCFPTYFSSLLGEKLLACYYGEFLKENLFFIVAEENGRVIGFCMGYDRNMSKARKSFLKKNFLSIGMRMISLVFSFNKLAISRLKRAFVSLFDYKDKKSSVDADGDLLSICVLDEFRGLGVSRVLVEKFEITLSDKGIYNYTLGVYKTNESAIRFYKKMGMEIVLEDNDEFKFYKEIVDRKEYL